MLYNGIESTYSAHKGTSLTNGKQLLKYWEGFNQYARHTSFVVYFKLKRPQPKNWYNIYLQVRDLYLSVVFVTGQDHIDISIYTKEISYYDEFFDNKDIIEKKLGFALEWQGNYIKKRREHNFDNLMSWEDSYQWYIDMVILFKDAFSLYC